MGEASCPKATIVVPVYNSARSIQRCVDSLLAQSERSIQVVCVNDGSTDDSLNVLRQIAQADDRVLVIDQKNEGVSCARTGPTANRRIAEWSAQSCKRGRQWWL